jgi:hypothetical protein
MRRLVAPLALLLLATAARAEAPMWRLRDRDSTVTLLGAVHALPEGVRWRGQKVDRALAEAEVVVFEMRQNPTPEMSQAASALMTELGRAKDGRTLSSRLSAAGRERLAKHAPAARLTPETYEGMLPWYVAFQLEWAGGRRDGGRTELGVERTLLSGLKPHQRTDALESPADVVRILSGYPEGEQVRMLEGLLESFDKPQRMKDDARELERAWAEGRTEAILAQTLQLRASSPTVYARLVSERNHRWLQQILDLLAGRDDVLVVVGAGHLVGPDGLPTLLRARGLKVEGR